MKKRNALFAVAVLLSGLFYVSNSSAYTFTPASSTDTDSGYLIDNYTVLINGSPVNSNFNFETGSLAGFTYPGTSSMVIDSLGSITPFDGSDYFAFVNTGPGSAPGTEFEHGNLMQWFTVESGDEVKVQMQVAVLTNEDPPTSSDPDWYHNLVYYSPGGTIEFPGKTLFYQEIQGFTFNAAPSDTGFLWITDPFTLEFELTSGLNNAIAQGMTEFEVHAVIAESYPSAPVPEPATMFLLGSGIVGLAGFRRKFRGR